MKKISLKRSKIDFQKSELSKKIENDHELRVNQLDTLWNRGILVISPFEAIALAILTENNIKRGKIIILTLLKEFSEKLIIIWVNKIKFGFNFINKRPSFHSWTNFILLENQLCCAFLDINRESNGFIDKDKREQLL